MIDKSKIQALWRGLVCVCLIALPARVFAFEPFVVEDIRVEGLQRIAAGTVFNYLPVKKGDTLDDNLSSEAIRALFKTGFFKDVVLEREGNTLVVFVSERPAIASIKVEGNEAIPKDQLLESLKQIGLAEGLVFDRSLLDRVQQELQRQYLALGKYSAEVKTKVTPLERNRVAVAIDIAEGGVATIRHINIVGNRAYTEEDLLARFQLGVKPPISFFYSADQYSKQKLSGDLEALRSFYLDRGYINFNIESTQVSITPDKRHVYITINIVEGEQFRVKAVKVTGETIVSEEEVLKLISLEPGQIFSRKELTESSTRIGDRLGEVGYAFANVNPVPEVDEAKREVALTFFVDPGKRVYVRRINISGNVRTRDEVLRREIRQMEGAPLETALINRSRTRLNRLGFFDAVNVETPPVPGEPDQVDVNFDVVERETFGSLNVGVGYGNENGLLLNASIIQDNFVGSGNRFTLSANNSKVATEYSFSFTNPYYTLDGVSRSFNIFYRATDPTQVDIATGYSTDAYGTGLHYGVPISEYNTFRYGFDVEHTRINTTSTTSAPILDFCRESASIARCEFDALKSSMSWSADGRDRAIFPTDGTLHVVGADVALPAGEGSISFYKASYRYKDYTSLDRNANYVFTIGGEIAYGAGYGGTRSLPPFEKYYAGGVRTLRGYGAYSLGPRDAAGNALGGDARLLGNAELIFPGPFSENNTSARLSAFIDAGNVFDTDQEIRLGDLRYSAGLALNWLTPIGPLSFSYAQPLNRRFGDETERFQFNIGAPLD